MTSDILTVIAALTTFFLGGTIFVIHQEKARQRRVQQWDAIAAYYASQSDLTAAIASHLQITTTTLTVQDVWITLPGIAEAIQETNRLDETRRAYGRGSTDSQPSPAKWRLAAA